MSAGSGGAGGLVPIPTYRGAPATPASDVEGVDLAGERVTVDVVGVPRWTLLLFLSTACDGCADLWAALRDPVAAGLAGATPVVVTRGPESEDPEAVHRLAPPGVAVVQSSGTWRAYRVQGPPFFALVDGPGRRVATEGVAWAAPQVAAHVALHLPTGQTGRSSGAACSDGGAGATLPGSGVGPCGPGEPGGGVTDRSSTVGE